MSITPTFSEVIDRAMRGVSEIDTNPLSIAVGIGIVLLALMLVFAASGAITHTATSPAANADELRSARTWTAAGMGIMVLGFATVLGYTEAANAATRENAHARVVEAIDARYEVSDVVLNLEAIDLFKSAPTQPQQARATVTDATGNRQQFWLDYEPASNIATLYELGLETPEAVGDG